MRTPTIGKLQTGEGKQVRYEHPNTPKNITFNLTPPTFTKKAATTANTKALGRNDKINVVYQDGSRKDNIKFKYVQDDIAKGKCKLTNY